VALLVSSLILLFSIIQTKTKNNTIVLYRIPKDIVIDTNKLVHSMTIETNAKKVEETSNENEVVDIYTIDAARPLPTTQNLTYAEALAAWADENNNIIIVYVDKGYLNMAFNFMEVSIMRNGIKNILFTADGPDTCLKMEKYHIPCFVVQTDFKNMKPNGEERFGTRIFLAKMNIRIDMILDALKLGYNILHSDGDIVYQSNPWDHMDCGPEFDICPLWDHSTMNAGFVYIKCTNGTIWLYSASKMFAHKNPRINDQVNMVKFITEGAKANKLKYHILDKTKFLSGKDYFEKGRHFYNQKPCNECVVIHDNWIVGNAAKVYRLRENLMWMYDDTNHYFSDPNRRYVQVFNPQYYPNANSYTVDTSILKAGLTISHILNRTLIIPRLHCGNSECSLLSKIKMIDLDKHFHEAFRESVFLEHPKVPKAIKESGKKGPKYIIATSLSADLKDSNLKLLEAKPAEVKETQIRTWLGNINEAVIVFHSLYDVVVSLSDNTKNDEWQQKLKNAIKPGKYLQM
jgi:hypothetical protein